MPINVGDLLREKERLEGVIQEAKIARSRIKQINVLITMYGDDEKVPVKSPMTPVTKAEAKDIVGRNKDTRVMKCPKCPGKTFKGQAGLSLHTMRTHGNLKGSPAALRRVS